MMEITGTLASDALNAPELDDFDREVELTRQNKTLMEFLDRRAQETSRITLAEAKAQLGLD